MNSLLPQDELTSLNTDVSIDASELYNLEVSYGPSVKSPFISVKPFSDILEIIRTGNDIIDNINAIRACDDDEKRRELKQQYLPWFNMGRFISKRRKEEFQSAQFIILDCDHLAHRLGEVRSKLVADSRIYCLFTSPSGDGLKVICKLDKPITDPDKFAAVYKHHVKELGEEYGFTNDKSTHDASRTCFLSYDPDLYLNLDATPLAVDTPGTIGAKPARVKRSKSPIADLLKPTVVGNRTPNMTKLMGHCMAFGVEREEAISLAKAANTQNATPLADDKVEYTVNDMYERYAEKTAHLPVLFNPKGNCYFKTVQKGNTTFEVSVSTFTIEPKELLVLADKDCLICDVTSSQGYKYEGIRLENADWHTKQKLLKAIGHQDCVFHGSDNDVQALCAYVNAFVPIRKIATPVIGLYKDTWVVEGLNVTAGGISLTPEIIPYEKGTSAFYQKIGYADIGDAEYTDVVRGFCADVTAINRPEVILPWLGWMFAVPMKEKIREVLGAFPAVLVHGSQGSGKTSTAKMLMRLSGYKNAVPSKCDMRPFPMLKLLSATNGIPVFLDEFKKSDMKDDLVDSLMRYIRESYDGEVEQKGREDQTTVDYQLLAPMCVMGEWNIDQSAIRERVLMVRFSNAVKKNPEMQSAFARLMDLELESFMPKYIQFCLNQDIKGMLQVAREYVELHFSKKTVAPRVLNNLAVMMLGLVLFQEFAISCGMRMPISDIEPILDMQLEAITLPVNRNETKLFLV